MPTVYDVLDQAISSAERTRTVLRKSSTKQVTSHDERSLVKAMALTWLSAIRPSMSELSGDGLLRDVDSKYQALLEASERSTLRTRYLDEIKLLKSSLVALRSHVLVLSASGKLPVSKRSTPPDFKLLIPDPAMQAILIRRWAETWDCLDAGAYLASTVMMGALLEALLLARINRLSDKSPVFTSKCAPRDRTNKTLPLPEWTLNSYIDVAHDMGWIGKASRDIGVVLRDYRNFIHPEKELRLGFTVKEPDCRMFGAILEELADQIMKS